jgi:cobalt-zinc-cadmium efflux system membrane fusion protein
VIKPLWGGRVVIFATSLTLAAPALASAAAIKLSKDQERALGVRTAAVAAASATPIATLPGLFVRPPSGRSAVSAPFAGSVVEVAVIEGQAVGAGQTLATIFSREALDENAALATARSEAAIAAATAQRTRKLVDEGIVAAARATEAESRAAAARSLLNAKARSIQNAGVDASGRYRLRAPFAGRVVSVDIAPGQGVAAMAPAFVVDREGRIQVDAVMPAALAGRVRPGDRAAVEGVEGKVVAVGGQIDPKTRSISVRAEVPPRPAFIPGRAARLSLFAGAANGLNIPRSALTKIGGRDAVFVRTAGGFASTFVTVLGYSGDQAALSGSLKPGAQVAVAGVSELKAMASD